jgi:hypothetical protein
VRERTSYNPLQHITNPNPSLPSLLVPSFLLFRIDDLALPDSPPPDTGMAQSPLPLAPAVATTRAIFDLDAIDNDEDKDEDEVGY